MSTSRKDDYDTGGRNKDACSSTSILPNALGSATAGIISRIFTHPLDTAKARLQAVGTPYSGPVEAITLTFRAEGLRGLYGGFRTVLLGGTPGTVLYLCSYDALKDYTAAVSSPADARTSSIHGPFVHFACGMVAETIACIIYVPVDVIKERMQVQKMVAASSSAMSPAPYNNGWDALRQILRNEGIAGIYRGYGATLASFGPFSAFYFAIYEQLQSWTASTTAENERVEVNDSPASFGRVVLNSCAAGAFASWLTSPLDMAKLRLQVQRQKASAPSTSTTTALTYNGMVDCLRRTFRAEGFRGLFRGAGARVLHFAPATTITMSCYESFRVLFDNRLNRSQQ